jgi:hypothetical protein
MKNSKILVLAILAYLPTHIYGQDMKLNLEQTPEDLKIALSQVPEEQRAEVIRSALQEYQFSEISSDQVIEEFSDAKKTLTLYNANPDLYNFLGSLSPEVINKIILSISKIPGEQLTEVITSILLEYQFPKFPGEQLFKGFNDGLEALTLYNENPDLYNLLGSLSPEDINKVTSLISGIPKEQRAEAITKALNAREAAKNTFVTSFPSSANCFFFAMGTSSENYRRAFLDIEERRLMRENDYYDAIIKALSSYSNEKAF